MAESVAKIWSDGDSTHKLREHEQPPGRCSGSGVALAPWALHAAATYGTTPHFGSGVRFVSATQDVHGAGLARETSEAVKDVGPTQYLCGWARRRSRTQRVTFCAMVAALVVCVVLACVLGGRDEWYITREMWGSRPDPPPIDYPFSPDWLPLRVVVVHHTVGDVCHTLDDCSELMRDLQEIYFNVLGYDLPYNFVLGNDGRVYEGRGWYGEAAHTPGLNRCGLGLGFKGDYRRDVGNATATALQMKRTQRLLDRGVRDGFLHDRYVVIAAKDVRATNSPGDDLHEALQELPHFIDDDRYRDMECGAIYAELQALEN